MVEMFRLPSATETAWSTAMEYERGPFIDGRIGHLLKGVSVKSEQDFCSFFADSRVTPIHFNLARIIPEDQDVQLLGVVMEVVGIKDRPLAVGELISGISGVVFHAPSPVKLGMLLATASRRKNDADQNQP
jgi:hypothetical protein